MLTPAAASADTRHVAMPPSQVVIEFKARPNYDRCVHCVAPFVDVPAYPRPGRRRACLAGSSSQRKLGALPCGAPRWADRAASFHSITRSAGELVAIAARTVGAARFL